MRNKSVKNKKDKYTGDLSYNFFFVNKKEDQPSIDETNKSEDDIIILKHCSSDLDRIIQDENEILKADEPTEENFIGFCSEALNGSVKNDAKQSPCSCCKEKINCTDYNKISSNSLPTKNEIYKCTECEKAFSSKGNLKRHALNAHLRAKSYKCDECEESFKQKYVLKNHRKIHKKKTKRCRRTFAQQKMLKSAFREKKYKCNQCPKSFHQKHYLKVHLKIHTGEKPFICEVCKKAFSLEWNLRTHFRIHNGGKRYKCNKCEKGFLNKKSFDYHTEIEHK